MLFPELEAFLDARAAEAGRIPDSRRPLLEALGRWVAARLDAGEPARLVFVCTHNSRRSHLAMVAAAAAAVRAGLRGVETFSAGTEATACHPNTVAALRRAGYRVEPTTDPPNPRYRVLLGDGLPSLELFSKTLAHPSLPASGFLAVMTCAEADTGCPVVPGAAARLALPYDDPKTADGTPDEAATYDARCAEITHELLWALTRAT